MVALRECPTLAGRRGDRRKRSARLQAEAQTSFLNGIVVHQKTLENRARRLARRLGLRVHKSQWRIGTKDNRGRFQVLDPKHERIIAGAKFDLTAEGVIAFCQKWVAKGRGA